MIFKERIFSRKRFQQEEFLVKKEFSAGKNLDRKNFQFLHGSGCAYKKREWRVLWENLRQENLPG